MAEPRTEAGRALLGAMRSGTAALWSFEDGDATDDALPLAIVAIEEEATAPLVAWLRGQSAEATDHITRHVAGVCNGKWDRGYRAAIDATLTHIATEAEHVHEWQGGEAVGAVTLSRTCMICGRYEDTGPTPGRTAWLAEGARACARAGHHAYRMSCSLCGERRPAGDLDGDL